MGPLDEGGRERLRRELERQLVGPGRQNGSERHLPFISMLQHVKAFREAHGRMPNAASGDWVESTLGRWFTAQRDAVTRGELPHALDAFAARALGRDWRQQSQDEGPPGDSGVAASPVRGPFGPFGRTAFGRAA